MFYNIWLKTFSDSKLFCAVAHRVEINRQIRNLNKGGVYTSDYEVQIVDIASNDDFKKRWKSTDERVTVLFVAREFATSIHFHPRLIFAGKASNFPLEWGSTLVSSNLACKY